MNTLKKLPKIEFKSVDDASLVRKFSVFFALMSFLPFIILSVLFFILTSKGEIRIKPDLFFWMVFLIGIFALIGFISMRRSFTSLMKVSETAKDVLKGNFSKRIALKTEGDNEVAQLARSFNEIVQQLESNIKQLENSRRKVQDVLFKIASGVSSTDNIAAFMELILTTTVDALDGNNGLLATLDENKNELVVKSSCGPGVGYLKEKSISLDDEVIGWVVKQKKPLLIPRLHKVSTSDESAKAFEPPLICAPLVFQNKVLGSISISGKKHEDNFKEDELVILSNIASQIALAMENARLKAVNQKAYFDTITALAMAVEARDVYSRGHSDRVYQYVTKIARKLNLSEEQIKTVQEAAQLHDVGKIGIADEILKKIDVLNEVERHIMEQHPIIGEGIILPLHSFAHLKDPIRHHHEWLNGQGYPDHLKGNQISLEAQILAVADCFDAMTTDRPYQKAKSIEDAKAEILSLAGERYDRKIVDALINSLT